MFKAVILAVLAFSPSAFADSTKLVCRELEGDRQTVVLEIAPGQEAKLGRTGSLKEGVKYDFVLSLYTDNQAHTSKEFTGTVETEDVMFSFQSKDGKLSFQVYMDEMDQSSLTVDGKSTSFACF
ncbi:MAG: hypothetical protein V4760_02330 [Bdellovibrionota bacterium]